MSPLSEPEHLCFGLERYFDSVEQADHEWCAKMCATCPALELCARRRDQMLAKGLSIEGTWAGVLYGGKREPVTRPQCGTHGGPTLHRQNNEWTCDECLAFRQRYERERYAMRAQERAASA